MRLEVIRYTEALFDKGQIGARYCLLSNILP